MISTCEGFVDAMSELWYVNIVTGVGAGGVPETDSKAPMSGADPEYGRPASAPASIRSDPDTRWENSISGREPSGFLVLFSCVMSIFAKSASLKPGAPASHVL